ncbi:MAG: RIP metalloprotease RseP [Betaproteobacteria bacterium]|nr:RIP metalloprotease RseP [Betaproteobacteria bacterium]
MSDILSWFLTNPFVAFIALVGVVVFVHELGHYLAGVWMNIAIEEFSLGFGPTAWSFKRGRTEYKLCWLPLGGYVRFFGQESGEAIPPELEGRALNTAPVYKRSIISAAGPFANFVLSLVVMVVLSKVGLPKPAPVVSVMPEGVARKAGLLTGDKIVSIAGEKVESWADINRLVSSRPEKSTVFEIERGASRLTLEMTPARDMSESLFGEPIPVGRIGVSQFFETPRIILAPQDSTLSRAGLLTGDKILEVNGKKVSALHDVEQAVAAGSVSLLVERMEKPEEHLLLPSGKEKLIVPTQTLTLSTASAVLTDEWAQTVRSSDMTVKSFDNLNKGDRKIPVQEAWKACGLKPGDTVFSWSGYPKLQGPIDLSYNFQKLIRPEDSGAVTVVWQVLNLSDNQMRTLECKIPRRSVLDALGRNQWTLELPVSFVSRGVAVAPVTIRSESLIDAVKDGAAATWQQATTLLTALKKLFSGDVPLSNLGGPIAIARVAGDAAEGGFLLFVLTISWMSLNIGLFNLLPLPALDGGHLLLQGVEAAYGKPLPLGVQLAVQRLGVALLLGLIVLVFFNDILRLFRS